MQFPDMLVPLRPWMTDAWKINSCHFPLAAFQYQSTWPPPCVEDPNESNVEHTSVTPYFSIINPPTLLLTTKMTVTMSPTGVIMNPMSSMALQSYWWDTCRDLQLRKIWVREVESNHQGAIIFYLAHCRNDIWPKVYCPTLFHRRKANSEKLHFFWGRV